MPRAAERSGGQLRWSGKVGIDYFRWVPPCFASRSKTGAGASGSCDGGGRRDLALERAAGAEKPLKRWTGARDRHDPVNHLEDGTRSPDQPLRQRKKQGLVQPAHLPREELGRRPGLASGEDLAQAVTHALERNAFPRGDPGDETPSLKSLRIRTSRSALRAVAAVRAMDGGAGGVATAGSEERMDTMALDTGNFPMTPPTD